MNDEVIDLLTRLWEYMDDKADFRGQDGETGAPLPNKEAMFAYEIDEMIRKL